MSEKHQHSAAPSDNQQRLRYNFSGHPAEGFEIAPLIGAALPSDGRELVAYIRILLSALPGREQLLRGRSAEIILPGLSPAAGVLLAEWHGQYGYFPKIRWPARLPGGYEYLPDAILDLADVRETARVARAAVTSPCAERTFVMLKPLGVAHALHTLVHEIERLGSIERMQWVAVTSELIEAHYAEHRNKPFFATLVSHLVGKSVLAMIIAGPAIVSRVREAIGPSAPRDAGPSQLRALVLHHLDGMLGYETQESVTYNVDNFIHASADVQAAEREIQLWFPCPVGLGTNPV